MTTPISWYNGACVFRGKICLSVLMPEIKTFPVFVCRVSMKKCNTLTSRTLKSLLQVVK